MQLSVDTRSLLLSFLGSWPTSRDVVDAMGMLLTLIGAVNHIANSFTALLSTTGPRVLQSILSLWTPTTWLLSVMRVLVL